MKISLLSSTLMAFLAGSASAATLNVASYDMPNGAEYTSYSGYEYFDESYNGTGDTTVSGAQLSGGTGDLTDGVIGTATWEPTNFFTTPEQRAILQAGMRPYVGWFIEEAKGAPYEISIQFNFAQQVTINSLMIHGLVGNLDRSSHNEPTMPDYFHLTNGGTTASLDLSGDPLNTNPQTTTFARALNAGGMTGSLFTLSFGFNYDPTDWYSGRDFVFLSEVTFDGEVVSPVPVPASLPLIVAGLSALGVLRRRRKG